MFGASAGHVKVTGEQGLQSGMMSLILHTLAIFFSPRVHGDYRYQGITGTVYEEIRPNDNNIRV